MEIITWFLPKDYSIKVAIKKISYLVGKMAVAGLVYGTLGEWIGKHLNSEQIGMIQVSVTAVAAAGLEGVHDWARMKWPEKLWL